MQHENRPDVASSDLVIGIVGCGVMGRGIAQIASLAGAKIRLSDSRTGASFEARDMLASTMAMLVQKGRLDSMQATAAINRLHGCTDLQELADCHIIIEAIIEDLDAKKSLFSALEQIVSPDAILATNTSSLSITAIAAGLAHPGRVAGFHFFNPVPLMKIVEAVGGLQTTPAIVDYLLALGSHWGHTAVRARDTPGFIVNHAGRGFGTEGLRILAEEVTTVPILDRILCECAGFRLGPCELMDLTALDVSHPVMESIYHQYYQESRFRPQIVTRQMLTAGLLGKKVGRGFYRYDQNGEKESVPEPAPATALPPRIWISRARPQLAERIMPLIAQPGVTLEEGNRPSADALCVVTPLGDDATTCCAHENLDGRRTVGTETLFDLNRRRVVMTTPATTQEYREMAHAAFFTAGAQVSVIRDSAGLVAQRVVAHIINIACEIAQQGIADPLDIDRAVMLGLGYPHGPLAWGDRLGAQTVLVILNNLHQHSGDARYRPSAWLKRRAALGLSLRHKEI
jgi:3-hydroxybutyryl-CoA dehydrogenase